MDSFTLSICFRHDAYFPSAGLVFIFLGFVILCLLGLRLLYSSFPRSYWYYIIATLIYFINTILQLIIPWEAPHCITSSNGHAISIPQNGFPDAGLGFLTAVVFSNIIIFGSEDNRFMITLNATVLCVVAYAYYYSMLLYFGQIVATIVWTSVLCLVLFTGVKMVGNFCLSDPEGPNQSDLNDDF